MKEERNTKERRKARKGLFQRVDEVKGYEV